MACVCVCVLVTQSCLTLCGSMDCSPPGSSVHGILQARILEWVAIPFSRGSSRPSDRTWVSGIAGMFFTIWAMREAQKWPGQTFKCLDVEISKHLLQPKRTFLALLQPLKNMKWMFSCVPFCSSFLHFSNFLIANPKQTLHVLLCSTGNSIQSSVLCNGLYGKRI